KAHFEWTERGISFIPWIGFFKSDENVTARKNDKVRFVDDERKANEVTIEVFRYIKIGCSQTNVMDTRCFRVDGHNACLVFVNIFKDNRIVNSPTPNLQSSIRR